MTTNVSDHSGIDVDRSDDEEENTYFVIWDIQTKIMPAICGLGFATNILSLLVFIQPSLRRLSCSVYLAAKAVSDFLFLLTVFIIWLSRVEVGVFHTTGICQIVVFFSYFTAFVSIWLAVVLTVENLLCVIKPWYVQRTCNVYSASIITTVIIVLGIILYHFSLWNNGVISWSEELPSNVTVGSEQAAHVTRQVYNKSVAWGDAYNSRLKHGTNETRVVEVISMLNNPSANSSAAFVVQKCSQLDEFNHLIVAISYIDSLLTLFLPLFILAVTNAAIVVFAVRGTRRRVRLDRLKGQYHLPAAFLANQRHISASLETQASRFLFAVSMTTLLFHLPSHMVRLKSLVFSVTRMNNLLQRVFETLYYTHYAIGFFVYIVFGTNFRKVFLSLLVRNNR